MDRWKGRFIDGWMHSGYVVNDIHGEWIDKITAFMYV